MEVWEVFATITGGTAGALIGLTPFTSGRILSPEGLACTLETLGRNRPTWTRGCRTALR